MRLARNDPGAARPAVWVGAEPSADRVAFADGLDFELLVRQHQGFLRAWLRRLTHGDVHLADDLAQETFLRALRSASGFRGEAQPRTWLARIALNVWHDHLRRQRTTRRDDAHGRESADPEPGDAPEMPDGAPSVADIVARRLDIDRALERLPEAERTVVIHGCWGDLSQSEIAALTGMPLGTVKTLQRRALARLHRWLGEAS